GRPVPQQTGRPGRAAPRSPARGGPAVGSDRLRQASIVLDRPPQASTGLDRPRQASTGLDSSRTDAENPGERPSFRAIRALRPPLVQLGVFLAYREFWDGFDGMRRVQQRSTQLNTPESGGTKCAYRASPPSPCWGPPPWESVPR